MRPQEKCYVGHNKECLIGLPKKIYDFYHLDEADYTIMTTETNPKTIEILI